MNLLKKFKIRKCLTRFHSSSVLSVLVCFGFFSLLLFLNLGTVYAESINLYASVNENDTNVKNLIGIYQNSPDYDPFNQFFVCRVAENEYRLFYSKNLAYAYKYFSYYRTGSGMTQYWHYGSGDGEDLQVNSNGFVGVGNMEMSIASEKAESFKFYFIGISLLVLISTLFLFKIFRQRFKGRQNRGWDL